MVSTKELGSDWLKADDITDGDTAVILDEAHIEEADFGKQLQCTLEHKGQKKKFGFNKTNLGIMEEFVGGETKDWVGKKILLYSIQVPLHGKMVNGVRIGVPKQTAQQPVDPIVDTAKAAEQINPEEETPLQKCARGEHVPTTLAGGKKVCANCAEKL